MIVRFRLGNETETRPVHGKLDHHVSAGRKGDGFKQLHVSVESTKYGNTLFRPVFTIPRLRQFTEILRYPFASIYSGSLVTIPRLRQFTEILRYPFASIYRDFTVPLLRQFTERDSTVPRLRQFRDFMMPS